MNITLTIFVIIYLAWFVLDCIGHYIAGVYQAHVDSRRHYEFKAVYAHPPLTPMQWSMFLGDMSKDRWKFVSVVYETVTLTTKDERPSYPKTVAIFRRLKLKGV